METIPFRSAKEQGQHKAQEDGERHWNEDLAADVQGRDYERRHADDTEAGGRAAWGKDVPLGKLGLQVRHQSVFEPP